MGTIHYEPQKILIWGTTYPELSAKYIETVCTGGVLEDGRPVRLYPIPYRHLEGAQKFSHYQWIEARISKSTTDTRPETYKVDPFSITPGVKIPSNPRDEWSARADKVFKDKSWQFSDVEALIEAQKRNKTSLGVVVPREVLDVAVVSRTTEDAVKFREKIEFLKNKHEVDQRLLTMFEEDLPAEMKDLTYVSTRLQIHWKCHSHSCGRKGGHSIHKMQVTDWGTVELQRREGTDKARTRLEDILDLDMYAVRFFLGNLFLHPSNFMIVGVWYPKIVDGLLRFDD